MGGTCCHPGVGIPCGGIPAGIGGVAPGICCGIAVGMPAGSVAAVPPGIGTGVATGCAAGAGAEPWLPTGTKGGVTDPGGGAWLGALPGAAPTTSTAPQ